MFDMNPPLWLEKGRCGNARLDFRGLSLPIVYFVLTHSGYHAAAGLFYLSGQERFACPTLIGSVLPLSIAVTRRHRDICYNI